MPIALPPQAEQHRIVAKVNELMSLCDALEQAQESSINDHQRLVENLLAELTQTAPREIPSVSPFSKGSALQTGQEVAGGSPPLQKGEQGGFYAWQRIATHFDTLFTTEHSIDQLKQTILQLAVMGKLVPQDPTDEPASVLLEKIAAEKARLVKAGKLKKEKPLPPIAEDEKPFELPQGWEWITLSHLGVFSGGKTPSKMRPEYWDGDIPWVTPKDMKVQEIYGSEDHVTQKAIESELSIIPVDSLLMVVRSGILRRSLPVAITKVSVTVNQDMKVLTLIDSSLAKYLLLMLQGFEQGVTGSDAHKY